jgi:hypothetical protein
MANAIPKNEFVVDTVALILRLEKRKMGNNARAAFANVETQNNTRLYIPSLVFAEIPELHDRLIAGTAAHINLPIITNDPVIAASSQVQVVW